MSCPFYERTILGGINSRAVLFATGERQCALITGRAEECVMETPMWNECERNPENTTGAIVAALRDLKAEGKL